MGEIKSHKRVNDILLGPLEDRLSKPCRHMPMVIDVRDQCWAP
jgi:hypothetical protein